MSASLLEIGQVSPEYQSMATPEGVPINLRVAPFSRRAIAFILDFVIIFAAMFLLGMTLIPLSTLGDNVGGALALLAWFFTVNFYFPLFEGLRGGMTPGKMLAKVRVVDRNGGTLTLRSIFTRNFMRDLELWLPIKFLLFGSSMMESAPSWTVPLVFLWALVMVLFPLFNKRRLRLGDLLGGTMVVEHPRMTLLKDLAGAPGRKKKSTEEALISFTPEQLSVYGVFELQVLEEVLRTPSHQGSKTLRSVAKKIAAKINWESPMKVEPRKFLEAFYRAQRAHLENQMMLGKKKLNKLDTID